MRVAIEVQRLFRRKKHGMEIVALEILRELQQRQSDHQYAVFVKDDVDHGCLEESKKVSINILKDVPFPIWE
ncbi:MAG: hypothetical protein ABI151_14095, partial [Chitinophagaceae bacterium]